MAATDTSGEVVFSLTINDEYYKFMVELDGELKKITEPSYISNQDVTDGIPIQINTGSGLGDDFFEFYSISHDLSFNNNTNNFRLDWSDPSGLASQFCLKVYNTANFTNTIYNQSCTTGGSGTILVGVERVNGTTYLGKAYYNQSGLELLLDTESYTFPETTQTFGTYGLFLQVIITVFAVLTAFASPALAAIMVPFSLIAGKVLSFNIFSWGPLIGMQIVGLVLAMAFSKGRG